MTWVVCLLAVGAFGYSVYTTRALAKSYEAEATRLFMLADLAMTHVKAGSVEESVKAQSLKKEYDVRLAYYRDVMAKEAAQATKKVASSEKIPLKVYSLDTSTEEEVDSKDLEILG